MLPVARLIGHKEWTRRKSDPRHSMTWRRDRVANFRPRQPAPAGPAPELEEDDVPTIVYVANGGIWLRDGAGYDWISDIATVASLKAAGAKEIQVSVAQHDSWVAQQRERHQAVDSTVLADAVKEALAGVELPAVQVDAVEFARAFHDEADRRARDGDPATGPVS